MDKIVIGSRGSQLARVQAEWVASELRSKNPSLKIEYKWITTSGDEDVTTRLEEMGGKGVFVKEIEKALFAGDIDVAVHSLKDMPQMLPDGLSLTAFPKREDCRDVLVSRFGEQLHELPRGSTIGTSSPRRKAQILRKYQRKQYRIEPIRGNLQTRFKKLEQGDYDAIVLALAGMKRLNLEKEITQILDTDILLPAPCQGCLGLEIRTGEDNLEKLLNTIKDEASDLSARAERSFLQALGGDCFLPVAGLATIQDDQIIMKAMLLNESGTSCVEAEEQGPLEEAELIGAKCAGRILRDGGSLIMVAGQQHESK